MAKKGGGAKVSATEVVPRYLQIMRSLPVHPDSTDVASVMRALEDAGFIDAEDPGDRRMVQRDLQKLSTWFEEDIERVSQNHAKYAWKRSSVLAPVAGFSNVQLCTLHILERFLRTALPPAVTEVLDRQFEEARSQMGKAAWRHARWPKKIRVEGLGFHPAPPKVTPGVYEEAYRALWDDKVCRVKLRTPHAGDGDVLDLHPLGLLLRDGLLTMVALEGRGNEPKEFHLHRMRSARALDQDRRAFPFDLATYESTKDPFDPSLPRKVKLAILFDRAAPLYPAERPFSDDQRLTRHDARRDRLEATVPNTRYLVAWLRGYGPRVEVLEPEALRSLFATEAAAAHTMYGRRARRRGGAPSS